MSERSIADILDNEVRLARQVQTLREQMREQHAIIEALREWCERGHYHPGSLNEWQRGFLTARREVIAILDGAE